MRSTQPQLSPEKYIPLLELNNIERGTMIHKPNDLSQVHWQFTSFKVVGIDNDRQMLLVRDLNDTPVVIPFSELGEYYVLKYLKGKRKKVKKLGDKKGNSSWDTKTYKQ